MEHYIIAFASAHEYWNHIFDPQQLSGSGRLLPLLECDAVAPSQFDYIAAPNANSLLEAATPDLRYGSAESTIAGSSLLSQLSRPVHLLVPNSSGDRKHPTICRHRCKTPLVDGSLIVPSEARGYGMSMYVTVCSPEFTFLQMALMRPFVDLLKIGCSYCGYYYESKTAARGFADRAPITTPERMLNYLDCDHGRQGTKIARRVAGYLLARSASPLETAVLLLLTLPKSVGGYGLRRPLLNYRIDVPHKLEDAMSRSYVVVDACWPKERLVMELNGREWHSGYERMSLDTDKINMLQAMGYTVIPVMYDQVKDADKFDALARFVRNRLGGHRRKPTDAQLMKRSELRTQLLP